MNQDLELKMQAWLDGELPPSEATLLSQALASNVEAQQLLSELKAVKTAMASNELEVKVPETREFYWSQIHRRIAHEEARQAVAPARKSFILRWRKVLFPLAGVVAALAVVLVTNKPNVPNYDLVQTTYTSSEIESMTFQDHASGMTVVWLQQRNGS